MGRKGWGGAPPADDAEARKRIVDAAVDRIERRGPRATTLSDIANDLGITRPTIYRYYDSIDDLLAAAAVLGSARTDSTAGRGRHHRSHAGNAPATRSISPTP